jgi:response regulator RpfG family c-di-GMP phosphodiesterase
MAQLKVLVVEDSPSQQRLIRAYLQALDDAEVVCTDNAEDGLEEALATPFDIILSDISLPGISGLELCRRVKAEADPPPPVVLVSTLAGDEDVQRGFEAGAEAYLGKPFSERELLRTVNDVLHKNMLRRGQHILVVDDSAGIRSAVSAGLRDAGFRVSEAEDGGGALELARSAAPDLILSDLNMPNVDGFTLCRELKKDEALAATPLVVMSASDDRGTMRRLVHMGAAAFLVKPFSQEQAVLLIEKLLDDHVLLMLKDREQAELERRMLMATITSLVQAIEARDTYTSSHSENVANVATAIAREMDFGEEELEAIELAGRLHDIGKIGICDSVLLKPGRLTDEEFDLIRSHPRIGYDILRHIPSLQPAIPAVLHHHEKFGGGGYPDGLAGETIPLAARILAVADVWHAVYSDRPYRPAMPREKAMGIIREERERGLCPACVDVFLALDESGRLPANV